MAAGQPAFMQTANWIAAARARETLRSDRLFADPYAVALAGEIGFRILARSEEATGENSFLPVRTRYFDDYLFAPTTPQGQIVLLGAGFDTRAYRLSFPPTTHVFELDQDEVLTEKEQILTALGACPTCVRHVVPVDLTGAWVPTLFASGFDVTIPTTWVAEGLCFYLAAATMQTLLRDVRSSSAPGSVFLADMFGTGLLAQPSMQAYLRWLAQAQLPPPFCTDQPIALFRDYGWQIVRLSYVGGPDANYGRLSNRFHEATGNLANSSRAYFVCAVL